MKRIAFFIIALVLSVFGVVTVFMSSSVIFDLFDIRSREGNYVLFIVWANLISGLLFIITAFAFLKKKTWTAMPLSVSAGILILAFLGLIMHINAGGIYEAKTVGAMIFRITINSIFIAVIHFSSHRKGMAQSINRGLFFLMSFFVLLGAGCSSPDGKTRDPMKENPEQKNLAVELIQSESSIEAALTRNDYFNMATGIVHKRTAPENSNLLFII